MKFLKELLNEEYKIKKVKIPGTDAYKGYTVVKGNPMGKHFKKSKQK